MIFYICWSFAVVVFCHNPHYKGLKTKDGMYEDYVGGYAKLLMTLPIYRTSFYPLCLSSMALPSTKNCNSMNAIHGL